MEHHKKKLRTVVLWASILEVPFFLLFLLNLVAFLLPFLISSTSTQSHKFPSSIQTANPTPVLSPGSTFAASRNKTWSITPIGNLYSSSMPGLGWDKGRTSTLSSTVFWNFGDMLEVSGFTLSTGFADGAAFYATSSNVLRVDMKNITNVGGKEFAKPWPGDPAPDPNGATPSWGMGTSNIVEVEKGVGLGFVWEIWRNVNGSYIDRGSGMIRVTLGEEMPIANRTGPLITGPDGLQVGLLAIMKAEGYIYTYSQGGSSPTGVVCGRAKAADAFNASAYEFQKTNGSWVHEIPKANDTSYGMVREGGEIHSDGAGSIIWSNYFRRYMLFVCAFGNDMNFYTSITPYGPWSEEYGLLHVLGYGVSVHPEWSPGGDGSNREIYISSGWGNIITMYKVNFGL